MSVINQMLKDLDKRQQESVQSPSTSSHIVVKQNQNQRWVILLLILLLVISLGIIIWQKLAMPTKDQPLIIAPTSLQTPSTNNASDHNTRAPEIALQLVENNHTPTLNTSVVTKITPDTSNSQNKALEQASLIEEDHAVASAKATLAKAQQKQLIQEVAKVSSAVATVQAEKTIAPSLTISRKQLTPDELASKKIAQAEQAIADKDIIKAEQLFEEVLLVVPTHKSARKKLAALWFGKQSYQAALNLLSQGLALDSQDAEFRLMKARIYLSQGQGQLALNVLQGLDNIRLIEYQSLLASTAQQLGLFVPAEKAYHILTELAPNVGRWWLGLAIAQDSQSLFTKAIHSYQNALQQQDLSSETAQFAKNRITELGE